MNKILNFPLRISSRSLKIYLIENLISHETYALNYLELKNSKL